MPIDFNKFKRSLVYDAELTADAIISDVAALRSIDKRFEKIERRWLVIGIVLLLPALVAFGAAFFMLDEGGRQLQIAGGAGGVLLLAAIIAFVIKSRYGRLNTEDCRYELLGQVAKLVRSDMAKEAPIDVALDLGAPDAKSKFDRKGKVGRWKVKYYVDPWLRLRGKLVDGTAFLLTISEKTQHRTCWKTSASGKSKRKTKTKKGAEVALQVKVKPHRYPGLANLGQDASGALQLPEMAQVKKLEVTDSSIVLRVTMDPGWKVPGPKDLEADEYLSGPHLVAMMFLSVYQILNLARALRKQAAQGGGA